MTALRSSARASLPARVRRALTRGEWAVLVALVAWSLVPGAILGWTALTGPAEGRFNGSDGLQLYDHLQYMAWIRDAGEHALFSNRFDTVADPHLFPHPMFGLSGLAWSLGVSIQVAFLAWKPVAIAVLFAGFAAYVRRHEGRGRTAAVVLLCALFLATPATPLSSWLGIESIEFPTLVIGLELFPAGFLWSVLPTAVTLGLVPLFLLAAEALLDPARAGRRHVAIACACGLLASWLHPWQGLTLIAICAGLAAWDRFDRRALRLALPVAATALPILGYFALSHTRSAWAGVAQPNDMPHFGTWLVVSFGPPLALGAWGALAERRERDDGERMLLLWPLAALAVYFGLQSSFFYHALAGLSLPLAILSARALRRVRARPAAVAVLVAVVTLPGMWFFADLFADGVDDRFFASGEARALSYLERAATPGAVVAPVELGSAVPAYTGRNTWVGHPTWTPHNDERVEQARRLFAGALPPAEARALVRRTRARYAVADCRGRRDLTRPLGPMLRSIRRFGCATVYELQP